MESEEIYINQEVGMQAAAFKVKQRGTPAHSAAVDDPNYENITVTLRKQDHPKGSHSPPRSKGDNVVDQEGITQTELMRDNADNIPARARSPSDSAQAPGWLHRAFTSLYILLALISIILLVWVLVKNSEMSQELRVLKREIWNVSISARDCEEGQRQGWSYVEQSINNAKLRIDSANRNVQAGNERLKKLAEDVSRIKTQSQQIVSILQKMQSQQPTQPTPQ